MTKKEEIAALQNFTDSLPTYTYLRPWLESVLPEIEHEIRCDFPVSPSIQKTRAECENLRRETQQFCEQAKTDAETRAARIIQDALDRAQHIRSRARIQLADAINTLAA